MTIRERRAVVPLGLYPLSRLDSAREVVRQFTPNWFAATMGTGILAIALVQFRTTVPVLYSMGEVLWVLNIALFALFTVVYAARWIFFFDGAKRILGHPVLSMSFGCVPMGLATIINGFLLFGLPRFGPAAIRIAETLWWIDVAMAVTCGIGIPYLMFTRQSHSIDQMTAVWLLPMVAAEVAAVSGGLLAPHIAEPQSQLLPHAILRTLGPFSADRDERSCSARTQARRPQASARFHGLVVSVVLRPQRQARQRA